MVSVSVRAGRSTICVSVLLTCLSRSEVPVASCKRIITGTILVLETCTGR